MQNNFCSRCGCPLNPGVQFCQQCGASVVPNNVVYMASPKIPGRGVGIASMVLGIVGLIYAFLLLIIYSTEPIVPGMSAPAFMFLVVNLLSLIFACVAMNKQYKNGVSISGFIMGLIGSVFCLVCLIIAASV